MQLKRTIFIFLVLLCAHSSFAQIKGEIVQSRILILLDESSSMVQKWESNKEKFKASHELIMRLMDSVYAVNPQVEFGLRVFGHQHTVAQNDCYDTRLEVPFAKDNKNQMFLRLEDIHPLGVTPIAFALKEAAEKDLLDESHNVYSIILITDGGESCGGDICEVMKKLLKYKVYFKPYIVSLENDPALKATYSCMGDFLQVTKESEIPPAVSVIVKAFRPAIKINTVEYQDVQNIVANAPSVLKVNTPPKPARSPENIVSVPVGGAGIAPIYHHPEKTLELINVQIPAAKIEAPPAEKIAALPATKLHELTVNPPGSTSLKLRQSNLDIPPPVVEAPPRFTDKIAWLKPAPLRQFNVIFVIEDHTYRLRQVPELPPLKIDPSLVNVPVKPNSTGVKKREFKVETVDDKETTLEVYFTNGAGKYYMSTPQVVLLDPSNKSVIKKFYRTVDPAGNPDPQNNIAPGTYDLTIAGKPDFVLPSIKVELNKKNKVIVTIKNTSLSFAYRNENGDGVSTRPVVEFSAVVTERNKANGRVQEQKCTERLMYEPGNYHIVINTFPQDIRNVDIDFDESQITIPQPGFAKFTAEGLVSEVSLFNRLGDKFLRLCSLNLNDPRNQHLQLQPGEYQVHFQKGNNRLSATEKVVSFKVRATQEVTVELK